MAAESCSNNLVAFNFGRSEYHIRTKFSADVRPDFSAPKHTQNLLLLHPLSTCWHELRFFDVCMMQAVYLYEHSC